MVGFPADRKLSQINVDFSSLCNSFELEPEQKAQWAISSALKLKKKNGNNLELCRKGDRVAKETALAAFTILASLNHPWMAFHLMGQYFLAPSIVLHRACAWASDSFEGKGTLLK